MTKTGCDHPLALGYKGELKFQDLLLRVSVLERLLHLTALLRLTAMRHAGCRSFE